MKKRLLSAFMALALCLTLLPAPAWAGETGAPKGGAAQIGNTVYSTLPEAVNAAKDGDTIKLLADYKTAESASAEGESDLTITKSVTLDLNGYEMDGFRVAQVNGEGATLPSGNLTVEDASAAKTGKVTGVIELVAGKLTINGGTIGDDRDGVSIENGNLIVNGGTMDFLYGSNSGTVTITGGTVKNARFGPGFEITVTGGSGHTGLWDVSEGKWNISGGEFGEVMFKTASPAKNAPISGGTFGKITRKNLQNNTETPAPISGLLADGYAFYAQAAGSKEYDQYVKLTDAITSLQNVQVKGHTHNIENGVCTVCNQQMKAQDNTGKYYLDLQEAFAGVADGGTVTMLTSLKDDDRISFCKDTNKKPVDKTVTLMMKGQSLSFDGASPLYVESGKLIIGDEATISQTEEQTDQSAVWVDNHDQGKDRGTLEFKGKATITGGLLIQNWGKLVGGLKEGSILTKNSEYSVSVERSETYSNVLGLLGDGLAFAKKDSPTELVKGNVNKLTEDVIVVPHTHSPKFTQNPDENDLEHTYLYICDCGFVCPHDSFTNSICNICHTACTHDEYDNDETCARCHAPFAVRVEHRNNIGLGSYELYMKTTAQDGTDNTLQQVFNKAESGSTVTLLVDGLRASGEVTGKTITLDLNGTTIDSGSIEVGHDQEGNTNNPSTLKITGSGSIAGNISVGAKGMLDLTGWTGRIGSLTVQSGGKATLNGGTFATLNIDGAAAGSLLASGYAFQNAATGAYVEYSSTADMKNVKVVKCPHSGVTLKEDHTGAECKYCGASFAATLNDAPYGTIDAAVTEWLENGGTLKLYDDARTDPDFSAGSNNPFIIDLNGHKFVYNGSGRNKLSGGKSLTIRDSSGQNGEFSSLIADSGTLTLESGCLLGLTVPSSSTAKIFLRGGTVRSISCPYPAYTLLGNGYYLHDGKNPVDLAKPLNGASGLTVGNVNDQMRDVSNPSSKDGTSSKDKRKIPFALALQVTDSDVEQMQFSWYLVGKVREINGKEVIEDMPDVRLATAEPVNAANGVYAYDTTIQGDAANWEDLEVGTTYDVICVVTGINGENSKLWQTPLKNYRLTIEQTDLKDLNLTFKQVADTGFVPFMGNIRDGKGTFVFTPYGGDVNGASTLTYCFEVSHDGQKLIEGKDYTIKSGNTAQYAGDHTLTIQGIGSYTGTATHTWRIEPYKLTRGNYRPPTITKVYDGTTGFDFSKAGNWGIFTENVDHRPNDEKTGKNPVLGSDGSAISIYLKPEDFKASAVTLDSPDAGDRTASFTIELKTRDGQREPNFVFEDGGSPTIQVTGAAASITKAPAPTGLANGALTVYNGTAKTYEIDIASLLPSPGAGCRYGEIYDSQTISSKTYKTEITEIKLDSSYYDKTADKAKIEKGKLILPIRNVNTTTTGKIGTIKLNVISQNYHQIQDWTIDVSAANQPVSTGGSSSGSTAKTDTVTNPDGSVTKTETKSDGTKIQTTTGKDGSVSKTTTNPNGSSVTENKAADGSTGTVKTDKHGQTTAETTLSNKAIETAKRNGEPVTAPVEVEASRNSNTAPTVKVELPKGTGETKVEIPVTNVKPGTVAVLVKADGTEEIVKNSLPTADGIQLTVDGGATVKIVDNSKDFADTRNHWAKDAIDFVSARGLVNGMNAVSYAPDASTTRAQLWTILARQNNADLNGGATWFENAQNWAKEKGISDGTNPNGTINRAQMVTMLWRAMGQPAAASGASFADVPADSYYAQAVAWAVENGITAGVGNGRFDPNSTCTRGQIATFLYRLYLSR